ncbi:MAG: ArsR/SmtB family transcription factor [bacterium]
MATNPSKQGLKTEFGEFFPEAYIKRASKILRLISEESKLRIMLLLAKEGHCRVTDISEALNINQTTISHHLALLRNADLVTATRDGKNILYDINDPLWREMGKQFFDYLQKGDNIRLLGKFVLKRLSK